MIAPRKPLFVALAVLAMGGLAVGIAPDPGNLWWLLFGAVLLIGAADAWLSWRYRPVFEVERKLPMSLPLGGVRQASLRLRHPHRHPVTVEVFDHPPETMGFRGLPGRLVVAPFTTQTLEYTLLPRQRGEQLFTTLQLRTVSKLKLWQLTERLDCPGHCRVYPDFRPIGAYARLAAHHRLGQMGIHQLRRRGEGREFHQLREFRHGDPLRRIDWKATSRQHKLISREYIEERNQEILLLLDCGLRMRTRDQSLSHFDHSLNAALLLAWVALQQEDAVGVATFGGPQRWLPPARGHVALHHILNKIYDLQPGNDWPDYAETARNVLLRQKKRALVIFITNVRDEDNSDLHQALSLLKKHHLVLIASLREEVLATDSSSTIHGFDDALRLTALYEYLHHRQHAFNRLRSAGAIAIDSAPSQLSAALVNQYLAIKSSGQL